MKSLLFFQTSDRGWPACGRLGRQTSARTKTSACLNITFMDMTYPKGWTGSLPLCSLIFSWPKSLFQLVSLLFLAKVASQSHYTLRELLHQPCFLICQLSFLVSPLTLECSSVSSTPWLDLSLCRAHYRQSMK